jgi:hypothetical protein
VSIVVIIPRDQLKTTFDVSSNNFSYTILLQYCRNRRYVTACMLTSGCMLLVYIGHIGLQNASVTLVMLLMYLETLIYPMVPQRDLSVGKILSSYSGIHIMSE